MESAPHKFINCRDLESDSESLITIPDGIHRVSVNQGFNSYKIWAPDFGIDSNIKYDSFHDALNAGEIVRLS